VIAKVFCAGHQFPTGVAKISISMQRSVMAKYISGRAFLATPTNEFIEVWVVFEVLVSWHWIVKELIAVATLKVEAHAATQKFIN
jgi:hypothetical protein